MNEQQANYCVYRHTSPTGKVYIGITQQKPADRWKGGLGYKQNAHFFRAIIKHGWDNFQHDVLCTGFDKDTAYEVERALISAYHSNDKAHGYNLTEGGEVFPQPHRPKKYNGGLGPVKPVICIDTGAVYESIGEAARINGVDKGALSRCCQGDKGYKTAGGLRWAYYKGE